MLDHHADLTIKDVSGNTAAHYCAFDKRREAYLLLKRYGYDEETVNDENKTALDYVSALIEAFFLSCLLQQKHNVLSKLSLTGS